MPIEVTPEDEKPPAGVGTADVDDEVEDEDDGQDDAGAGQDDDAPALRDDGQPVTAKDWRAMQDSLKAARRDARTAKRGKAAEDRASQQGDDEKAQQAAATAAAKFKPIVVKQAARAAFAEAGLSLPKGREESALKKALKLIDMDDLDLTDDGDVEGLIDQIEDIKADYPELFTRPRPGRIDAGSRGTAPEKKKSSAEILASALMGE